MKTQKQNFTLIELATSIALIVVLFGMISFVFQAISVSTLNITDKLQEADKANKFFGSIGDDIEAGYPVFYLGDGSSGETVNIGLVGAGNPFTSLPLSYTAPANVFKPLTAYGSSAGEFFRCVSSVARNGGPQYSNGSLIDINRENYLSRPIRYYSYIIAPDANSALIGNRSVIRREIFMRPDVRKGKGNLYGYVLSPGVVDVVKDADVREVPLIDGVWEVRVEMKEIVCHVVGNNRKVAVKVTLEFAYEDESLAIDDVNRYTQYATAAEIAEHTYTAVFVTTMNPLVNMEN